MIRPRATPAATRLAALFAATSTAACALLATSPAAAYATLLTTSPAAARAALLTTSPAATLDTVSIATLQRDGLTFQISAGLLGAEGPAARIAAASAELRSGHVGTTAFYTGAHETGTGFLIVSGDDVPPLVDFEVLGMTAASVANNSAKLDAVYSDDTSQLAAVVPADSEIDITPVDIDYAVYPLRSTPPPDNRGLNPDVQFTFN